jgi:hypothetical protein
MRPHAKRALTLGRGVLGSRLRGNDAVEEAAVERYFGWRGGFVLAASLPEGLQDSEQLTVSALLCRPAPRESASARLRPRSLEWAGGV